MFGAWGDPKKRNADWVKIFIPAAHESRFVRRSHYKTALCHILKQWEVSSTTTLSPRMTFALKFLKETWGNPRSVVVNVLNGGILAYEFELKSRYYIHFRTSTLGKGMRSLLRLPSHGLNITLISLKKSGFGITYSMKVDMALNKETKPN